MPNLPHLNELDLSNNTISDDRCLPKFCEFPNLKTIIMTGCPYAEEKGDSLKNEILVVVGTVLDLKRVNEDEVTKDDKDAAKEDRDAREKARLEAEEEARRAEEERLAAL
jgi:hypothetical protein